MLAARIAVTTFGTAVLCFILAEGLFDHSDPQITESHCRSVAPVPALVSVLNGLATGLLLAAAVSLLCLLVLLLRCPSERSAVTVPLTTAGMVASVLFMFGAGYETVRPEPASTGHNPCAFSNR